MNISIDVCSADEPIQIEPEGEVIFLNGSGENGATFIPFVSDDGVMSWTNDKGLKNPTQVNIKGPKGDKGDPLTFDNLTDEQKAELKGEKGDPLTFEDLTEEQKEELKGDPLTFDNLTDEQKAKLSDLTINPDLNLLVLGDSIFGTVIAKQFLQNIGCKVQNCAVSGATLAEISERRRADGSFNTVIDQLFKFTVKVNEEISQGIAPGDGKLAFHTPDVILMDGGANDYINGSVMGSTSLIPTHYLFGNYDFSTVMGGLEKLLHYITRNYPKAQKFFLTTHRVCEYSANSLLDGSRRYWAAYSCYCRVPYTRVENGKTITTWELLFNEKNQALTTAAQIKAATKLVVKNYPVSSNTDTNGDGFVDFTVAEYDKSSLYVNGDVNGTLDLSKLQGLYTYTTLRDNIVKICQIYGVKVIDLFNECVLNCVQPNVVTPVEKDGYWYVGEYNTGVYSYVPLADVVTTANMDFFSWKGVHPTALGYEIGYKNPIKEALRLGTKK